MKPLISAEELREMILYDPKVGSFEWRVSRRGHRKAGQWAGSYDKSGYWVIRIKQRTYPAHRLAWLYMTGEWPADKIDHKDLNKANNRWDNLREATNAQNFANRRPYGKSGIKGVYWSERDRLWYAKITKDGQSHHLGCFRAAEEAAEAYWRAAQEMHGQFARAA